MKQLIAEFLRGTVKSEDFPKTKEPEIAFAGRSNVGKSSLLNSIVNRKNLAKISSTPGKTKQINFFSVENKFVFADLPGFGYASVSKTDRASFAKLNNEYLTKRENLKLVVALCDIRHDPQENDLAFWEFLEQNEKKFIVVLTKSDKIKPREIVQRKVQVEEVLKFCKNCIEVLPYSSTTGEGRNQLFAIIKKSV